VGIAARPWRGRYDFVADQLQASHPCDILDVIGVRTTEVLDEWKTIVRCRT